MVTNRETSVGKEKIWFVKISGCEEGPYSFRQLKRDRRLTPDTLIRRADWEKWCLIRQVPELVELFKDEQTIPPPISSLSPKGPKEDGVLVMNGGQMDPFFFVLIVFVLVFLFYVLYLFNR